MSAKQNSESQTGSEYVVKGDALNDPLFKRFLKNQSKQAERNKIQAKIPQLLTSAGKLFGREFSSPAEIMNYVSPRKKAKKGKRSSRITAEQKAAVKQMRKENKSDEIIAAELKLEVPQVKRVK